MARVRIGKGPVCENKPDLLSLDVARSAHDAHIERNFTQFARRKDFKGFRLGVPRRAFYDEQRTQNPPVIK